MFRIYRRNGFVVIQLYFFPFSYNGDLFGEKYTDIGFCAYPVWHSIYFSSLKLHVFKPESLWSIPYKPSLSQLMATSFFLGLTITVITGFLLFTFHILSIRNSLLTQPLLLLPSWLSYHYFSSHYCSGLQKNLLVNILVHLLLILKM